MFKPPALIFLAIIVLLLPASEGAAFFKGCDFLPEKPMPAWTTSGIEISGHYTGVGIAEKRDSVEEQKDDSKKDALGNMASKISVNVESELKSAVRETSGGVDSDFQKDVSLVTKVSTEQLLRDWKVKDQWLNRKKCILYTLVAVSRDSVEEAKREMVEKEKFARMKASLARGDGPEKVSNLKDRISFLKDADLLLNGIDFSFLPAETKSIHSEKIKSALTILEKKVGQTKGRMLLAALESETGGDDAVALKLIDHIKSGTGNAERMLSSCSDKNACIKKAKEQGFGRMGIVELGRKTEVSAMGALKGTLSVVFTVYDVQSGRVVSGPLKSFAQVIGWDEGELKWDVAADKIIKSRKMLAKTVR